MEVFAAIVLDARAAFLRVETRLFGGPRGLSRSSLLRDVKSGSHQRGEPLSRERAIASLTARNVAHDPQIPGSVAYSAESFQHTRALFIRECARRARIPQ